MDLATQDRVFEPFFTTKPQGRGTGLGLSTVYGIVKQSDGHITIQSVLDRGTTFQLLFPLVRQAAEETSDVALTHHPVLRSGTLLLVEDEAPVREMLKKMLEARGFSVLCASGLDQAVVLCRHHPSPIQLLLTDVVMPRSSGREVAEAIGQLRPDIQVLFMSGHTDDEVLRHGVASGGASFVQKPFTSEILLAKIDAILESPNPSPSVTTT
jgi:CheY-like chemotaxis protein